MSGPNPPDHYARELANRAAGASIEELRQRHRDAHEAIDRWLSAYCAALDSPRHQLDIEPPLTVREAAELLRISESTVREHVRIGRIKAVQGIGDVIRINRSEIVRLLDDRR